MGDPFFWPVARVKMERLGRQAWSEISRKPGLKKRFRFLRLALGNGIRHEQGVAFERGGERRAPGTEFGTEVGAACLDPGARARAANSARIPRATRFRRERFLRA
jgi:hypothetical protein